MSTREVMPLLIRRTPERRTPRVRRRFGIVAAVLWALCPPVSAGGPAADAAKAADGNAYVIERWAVAGGGGRSTGAYTITGTIAQPDSDPLQPSVGGPYAITGGFWPGLARNDSDSAVFSDGFEQPGGVVRAGGD
jgi:hypothetical protein